MSPSLNSTDKSRNLVREARPPMIDVDFVVGVPLMRTEPILDTCEGFLEQVGLEL